MKSLGAIITMAVLVVSFVGASVPARDAESLRESPGFRQALEINEMHTGYMIPDEELQLLATHEFTLDATALGYQAVYDTATGALAVTPITALPDASGESGCAIVNSFVTVGYLTSPVGVGNAQSGCPFTGIGAHPGGLHTITLICAQNQVCYTFAGSFVFPASYGYAYLYCTFNTLTVAQLDAASGAGSSLGTGICQVFGFQLTPLPNLVSYYGYVVGSPPSGAAIGLVNW